MKHRRAQSTARWVIIGASLTVCLLGAGWLVLRWARPVVTVSEAVEAPVVQAFYSTGTVQPEREYPIKSNTAGVIANLADGVIQLNLTRNETEVIAKQVGFSIDTGEAYLAEVEMRAYWGRDLPLTERITRAELYEKRGERWRLREVFPLADD